MRFLSPFRYPGGKSWLIPEVKQWLGNGCQHLAEPFCGGASVSLEMVQSNYAKVATISDIDPDVMAVFQADHRMLCELITSFKPTRQNVERVIDSSPKDMVYRGFRALVLNRFSSGGVMAPGAGLMRYGEDGGGLASRWYPETLCKRLHAINAMRDRLSFGCREFRETAKLMGPLRFVCWFIDPPYSTAGRRLYTHHHISLVELFETARLILGRIMMTVEDSEMARWMASDNHFSVREIHMKSNHHATKTELILTREAKAD